MHDFGVGAGGVVASLFGLVHDRAEDLMVLDVAPHAGVIVNEQVPGQDLVAADLLDDLGQAERPVVHAAF